MPLCLCFLLILILLLLLQRSGTGLLASCCCAIATASLDLLPPARRPSLHSALGPSTRSTPGLLPQLIMPLIVGDSSKVVSRLMMLPILIRIILIVLVLVFFFPFHSILQFSSILSFHGRGPLPRAAYHGRFRLPTRPPPASSERPLQPVRSKLPPPPCRPVSTPVHLLMDRLPARRTKCQQAAVESLILHTHGPAARPRQDYPGYVHWRPQSCIYLSPSINQAVSSDLLPGPEGNTCRSSRIRKPKFIAVELLKPALPLAWPLFNIISCCLARRIPATPTLSVSSSSD